VANHTTPRNPIPNSILPHSQLCLPLFSVRILGYIHITPLADSLNRRTRCFGYSVHWPCFWECGVRKVCSVVCVRDSWLGDRAYVWIEGSFSSGRLQITGGWTRDCSNFPLHLILWSSWCVEVTDLHPDNHYIEGSLARTGCHHMPGDEHNWTSKVHPVLHLFYDVTDISTTTTHLAQTLILTIIVQQPTLVCLMDPAILPGPSSTLHSNTSTKSGKTKSTSSSGQVTTLGSPPSHLLKI